MTSHLSGWLPSEGQEMPNFGKSVEEREPLCAVDENGNRCSPVEAGWKPLNELKMELPHAPALPLRVDIQRKRKRDIKEMSAPSWSLRCYSRGPDTKTTECPSTGEWIKKGVTRMSNGWMNKENVIYK